MQGHRSESEELTLCTALVFERSLQNRATENPCVVFDKKRERTLNQNDSAGSIGLPPTSQGNPDSRAVQSLRNTSREASEHHGPKAFPNQHFAFPGLELKPSLS